MKRLIVLLSVLAFTALAVSSNAAAADKKPIKLKWAHVLAVTNPSHICALEVAKRVKERTNGGLEIKIYPSCQLGLASDCFEQQKMGAPIIAQTVPSWSADLGLKKLQLLDGPFLYSSLAKLQKLLTSPLVDKWNAEFMKKTGLRILTWNWYGGERHIISNKGYPTPDTFKGVKMRVPANPIWSDTFTILGATTVTVANWSEVYSALSRGVVDAVEAPMSSLLATKLFESAKVITLTGHFKATRGYQISEKLFQSLPKEYQKILTEEIIRGGEMMTKMSLDNRGKYIKKLKDVGVTFVTPDIAAYIAKIQPFYDGKGYEWTRNDYEQILKVLKSN